MMNLFLDSADKKISNQPQLQLNFGFSYADLYDTRALERLHILFNAYLAQRDFELSKEFEQYQKSKGANLNGPKESDLLIRVAPWLEEFLAELFGVESEIKSMRQRADDEHLVMRLKRDLWRKRASKLVENSHSNSIEQAAYLFSLLFGIEPDLISNEVQMARIVVPILDLEDRCNKVLAKGGATVSEEEFKRVESWYALSYNDNTGKNILEAYTTTQPSLEQSHRIEEQNHEDFKRTYQAKTFLSTLLNLIAHTMVALAKQAGPFAMKQVKEGPLRVEEGREYSDSWVSVRAPSNLDYKHLVHTEEFNSELYNKIQGPKEGKRLREGFDLTDQRMNSLEVANESDYCILCHDREKDSCRRGLIEAPVKSKSSDLIPKESITKKLKTNPLGVSLQGCPLKERIGEMHQLRRQGNVLAALSIVTIDNPMCPGTGHRICNDCMKGCIYQKQDPVNIPQVETSVLTEVLHLPWGVEIYMLLTRWNPLRVSCPYAKPYHGKNVLVVGLGPAGYTLAHHLLNEGFGVVGIDGLKLEPFAEEIIGNSTSIPPVLPTPIYSYASLAQKLSERRITGFGGVAEYGITHRWDKNFLDLIAITLLRRATFQMYGGVRFGGTITLEDAWNLGFHHVAIAAGAGKPTLLDVPNGLARGVRLASDFLMALQLSGAYKKNSLANIQVRLPALVIGGGLTAIDTATELSAYYIVQVERTLMRVETLIQEHGHDFISKTFDREEKEMLEEWCAHAREVRQERARAHDEKRAPNFQDLIEQWGGVTIAYRRSMTESPAYRLNHEEIIKCLEEGIRFVEHASPKEVLVNEWGAAQAMLFDHCEVRDGTLIKTGATFTLPARTICVAAGTAPNVTYEHEYPGTFELNAKTKAFRPYRVEVDAEGTLRMQPDEQGFFTSYYDGKHTVSFYGDNLPHYAGSVVKAMASAKDGHSHVVASFKNELEKITPADQHHRERAWQEFRQHLDSELIATIHEVIRLTPTIVEVIVRAPQAARKFQPGQFYRLQNFESDAPRIESTRLITEGIALTGAWVDREQGLLSTIVLEMGGSSRLCATLRKGQRVVLMGPTGAPTEIPKGENVVLVGGGLGNAVLFSIGRALRANQCKVIYFAGYRNPDDVFHLDDIEAAADAIVWAADRAPAPQARRPQDTSFVGNIISAMLAFAQNKLNSTIPAPFNFKQMDRMIVIGSDRMMAALKAARQPNGVLGPYINPKHLGIASVNSPMQCMMKEICAQCLQRHVDPVTGKVSIVFSCSNQDQNIDCVDFTFLGNRLRASSAQEKITHLWVERLLAKNQIPLI